MPVAPSTQTDSQTLNGFPALFFLAEEKPNLKNCQYPLKKKYPLNKKQKKAITDNKIINNEINYFELMPFFNCDDFTKETTEKKPITDNKIINDDNKKETPEKKAIDYNKYSDYEKNKIKDTIKSSVAPDIMTPNIFEINFKYLYDNKTGAYNEINYINTYKKINDKPQLNNIIYSLVYRKEKDDSEEFTNLKRNELKEFQKSPTRNLYIGSLDLSEFENSIFKEFNILLNDFITENNYIIFEILNEYMEDRKLFYNIVIHSIHKMPYLDETANNLYFYDELNELGQNKYIIMNVREYDITFKYTYDYNIKGSNINKIHYDIILSGEKKILKQNLAYEFKDEYIGRFTERKKEKMELIEKQSLKFLLLDSFLCIDNINEKHLKNIKNYICLFGFTQYDFMTNEKKKYIKMSLKLSSIKEDYKKIFSILNDLTNYDLDRTDKEILYIRIHNIKDSIESANNDYNINDKETLKMLYSDDLNQDKMNDIYKIVKILNTRYNLYTEQCKQFNMGMYRMQTTPKERNAINLLLDKYDL